MKITTNTALILLPGLLNLYGILFQGWQSYLIILFYIVETTVFAASFGIQQISRSIVNKKMKVSKQLIFIATYCLFSCVQIFFNIVISHGDTNHYFDPSKTMSIFLLNVEKLKVGIALAILIQLVILFKFFKEKEYKYSNIYYSKRIHGILFGRIAIGQISIVVGGYIYDTIGFSYLWGVIFILFQSFLAVLLTQENKK